jgi:hypothetical protein
MSPSNRFLCGAISLCALLFLSSACLAPEDDAHVGELDQELSDKAGGRFIRWVSEMAPNDSQVADLAGHQYLAWPLSQLREGDTLTLSTYGASNKMATAVFLYRANPHGFPVGIPLAYDADPDDLGFSRLTHEITTSDPLVALVRRRDRFRQGAIGITSATEGEEVACGGALGNVCRDFEYCHFEETDSCGWFGALGVCRTMPEHCSGVYDPVCGCNGATYASQCTAAHNGISVQFSEGGCGDGGLGAACGGPTQLGCNEGLMCDYATATVCDIVASGTCEYPSYIDRCTESDGPVCGCDGTTYTNDCQRRLAGVALDHLGGC